MTTTTEGGLYRLLAWLSPSFPVGAFSYSHGLEAAVEAGSVRDRASLERYAAAVLTHGTGRIDADLLRDAWRAAASSEAARLSSSSWPGSTRPSTGCSFEGAERRNPEKEEKKEPVDGRVKPGHDVAGNASGGSAEQRFAALLAVAARAEAHRGTAELALESRAQGEAFLATCRAAWGDPTLDDVAAALETDGTKPAHAVAVGTAAALAAIPLEAALTAYLHALAANLVSAGLRLVPLGQTDGQRCLAALEPVVHQAAAASLDRDAADFGACTVAIDLFSIAHETQYTRLFRS
jgi:urease accessory protein UreF